MSDFKERNEHFARAMTDAQVSYIEAERAACDLEAENAKLRDSLKALMMGTYAELCTDRDQPQCCECSMRRGDDTCVAADAMELLGIDMYGEPL